MLKHWTDAGLTDSGQEVGTGEENYVFDKKAHKEMRWF